MKARYLVMANLAVVLLSGCANEEKPTAPSDDTTHSVVESSGDVEESSHIEITPSSNSGVSSAESIGTGDSGVSSEVASMVNPDVTSDSKQAMGTIIHIGGEIFDTKWSFADARSNGWNYEPSGDIVRPNSVGMFKVPLTKGDKSVYVKVFNATESEKVSTECEIIGAVCPYEGASIGDEDSKIQFRVGMDLNTAKSVMNQVSSVQSYSGYESFTVSTDGGTLYYFVYNEYSKLASVGITHKASNGQTFIE